MHWHLTICQCGPLICSHRVTKSIFYSSILFRFWYYSKNGKFESCGSSQASWANEGQWRGSKTVLLQIRSLIPAMAEGDLWPNEGFYLKVLKYQMLRMCLRLKSKMIWFFVINGNSSSNIMTKNHHNKVNKWWSLNWTHAKELLLLNELISV